MTIFNNNYNAYCEHLKGQGQPIEKLSINKTTPSAISEDLMISFGTSALI